MCIVVIYDAVRAVCFAGSETIRNNNAATINFIGSRVAVLTHFRSGSCTHEALWVVGVFYTGATWVIFRTDPPDILINITVEDSMVNFAALLVTPHLQ